MHSSLDANYFSVTPWHCVICNGYFSQKCSLQRHMNDVHTEQAALYKCPQAGCPYITKRRADLLRHHRAHLKQVLNCTPNSPGKIPSKLQLNMQGGRSNPMQATSAAPATISKPPENEPLSNYQVTPFNTVNMEEFGRIISGTHCDNPSSTVINHSTSNTLPAQNSSTSVAIYDHMAHESQTELVLEQIIESGVLTPPLSPRSRTQPQPPL